MKTAFSVHVRLLMTFVTVQAPFLKSAEAQEESLCFYNLSLFKSDFKALKQHG